MSKLTNKNRNEMKILTYHMPAFLKDAEITPEDAKTYFDWSDRGVGAKEVEARVFDENRTKSFTGLSALYFGKRNRDLAITSYKEDWGTTCTAGDFTDEPREVVEFVSKAIGKPRLLAYWKMFNSKDELDTEDMKLLEPLANLAGYTYE